MIEYTEEQARKDGELMRKAQERVLAHVKHADVGRMPGDWLYMYLAAAVRAGGKPFTIVDGDGKPLFWVP